MSLPPSHPSGAAEASAAKEMPMRALSLLVGLILLAGPLAAAEPEVLERAEIAGDLVRERLLLRGCEPGSPVPAIAVYPKGAARLPLVLLMHWFQGSKEVMEPWAKELAPQGFFVVAPDLYLHGERSVKGIFDRPNLPDLGEEYSVFIHQTSISHSALDFPYLLDDLAARPEVDAKRVGVGGFSMGAGLSLVLAWREPRVSVVASIVGAADFWWDVTKIPPGADQDAKRLSYGPAVQRLVTSLDVSTRLDRIPPKALYVASGRKDHFIDIESMRRVSERLRKLYEATPERFRFHEEDVGHEFTESMRRGATEWFVKFLKAPPAPAPKKEGDAPKPEPKKDDAPPAPPAR